MTRPAVLTIPELAAELRIGRNAAYELVARGDIYGVRIGRSIRVPRRALELFLSEPHETAATDWPEAPIAKR